MAEKIEITVTKGLDLKGTLILNESSLANGRALKVAIEKALLKQGIKLQDLIGKIPQISEVNLSEELDESKLALFDGVLQIFLTIDSDEEVYKQIFNCLDQSIYREANSKDNRLNEQIIQNHDLRDHYYSICIACIKLNVLPFFFGLRSLFTQGLISFGKGIKSNTN